MLGGGGASVEERFKDVEGGGKGEDDAEGDERTSGAVMTVT